MDIRQLRYFIAVAEEANIGRAATRLHMSQPPLTRQIQQLEEELDTQLFVRTPRGMELTQAGTLFLAEARNIRALIEQATERTQRAGQGRLGRLDVAIFGSAILDRIPKLILNFRNEYPDVNVVLHTMTKAEQIAALRQNRITVGFNRMLAPLPDIRSEVIATEALLLAVNLNDPLAAQPALPFDALARRPVILFPSGARPNFVDKVLALCEARGFIPEVAQEVGDAVTGVALVASGFGVCVVPESATTLQYPGVAYLPFADAPADARVDLSCIYRADDHSPILTTFLASVRKSAALQDGAARGA
ncbi:LysR family transcriptional regulator [Azoarcus indigens]|uniref:LysR family transcriptional regulator n=1 Tax=Azoarcus indigens TaxID=29545 RepID=A0A4R6E1D0_9RHOO|nr:LysR substrate-binding domain-containing protein [Azoarcus indigens]NMG64796.1 LysR family transcriptional regulator [Azoarcus indigens]TDN50819.1 LysR family transcriptional regulator [Azoarcus indigens]